MQKQKSLPKVIAIVGPTATGKSALAVRLAKKLQGEVISVDSRQIYKGLNLGTGKITRREMRDIPHHLLDVASPMHQFSAAEYAALAGKAMRRTLARNKVPILCGGTGFYLETALGERTLPEVPPDPKLRKKLRGKSVSALFVMLKKLDPKRAKTIDSKNPHRLVRAIEIAKALGKVPLLKEAARRYDILKIGLALPQKKLNEKIEKRLKERLGRGMLGEAKKLHKAGLSFKHMEALGLEYRFMARHLSGKIGKKEMEQDLATAIRQYAKRQMTWFKRDKTIRWFDPKDVKKIEKLGSLFISKTLAHF